MSEPKAEMPGFVVETAAELCPSGLLRKLALVSKAFRDACKKEADFRAGATGTPLPPLSLSLLTTANEVEWAVKLGCPVDAALAESLAFAGALPALKKAVELNAPTDDICLYAAYGGHLEVLKWARDNDCPWDGDTCSNAAECGHLEVLKWALEEACPLHESPCDAAARGGYLSVLMWARENRYPWNETTCAYAAQNGHLEVLKWAREEACPWDEWTCLHAAERRHFDVLKWAIDNGAPWERVRTDILKLVRGTDAEGWYRALSQLDD